MTESRFYKCLLFLCGIIICGCSTDAPQVHLEQRLFSSIDPSVSDVDFANDVDIYDSINIVNYLYAFNGGGVAIDDLDGDGWSDIVFTANQGGNVIYYNKGNLEFEADQRALGENDSWSTGVTIVDINDDGLKDIYVCNVHNDELLNGVNQLFINQGNRKYKEEAAQYNLDIQALSTQSAFLDYDKDGDLDMYLLCHSQHSPGVYSDSSLRKGYHPLSADRLLENRDGKFYDSSKRLGIYQSKIGYGLGLVVSDVNLDGWPDIYVGNDFQENDYLYINKEGQKFEEVAASTFTHTSKFTMGCDIADVNRDGFPDIFSLDMRPEDEEIYKKSESPDEPQLLEYKNTFGYSDQFARNALQFNSGCAVSGNPIFSEESASYNLESTDWSWSVLMEDFNLDGLTDIFITNGIEKRPNDLDYLEYISNEIVQQKESDSSFINKMPSGKMNNRFFLNQGDSFEDASDQIDSNTEDLSQSAAYGDLDNDGDLDLVINRMNDHAILLENNAANNFVKFDVRSFKTIDVLGAKLWAYVGDVMIYKEIQMTRGFQSCVEPVISIGLGEKTVLDSLIIKWPTGKISSYKEVKSREVIIPDIYESDQRVVTPNYKTLTKTEYVNVSHTENDVDDFVKNDMLIDKISSKGPGFAMGDVNGDGSEDLFVGGAKGQPSVIYLNDEGSYVPFWQSKPIYEDVAAVLEDIDKDGDLDLIVAAGSGEYPKGHESNTNRIYYNNGDANFSESYYYIDNAKSNTRSVSLSDVDGDGWLDVFFGNHSDPSTYGLGSTNRMLRNIRGREFIDIKGERIDGLDEGGMITDAIWADLNDDGYRELVVVGSWMPVTIYWNSGEGLSKETLENTTGLYNKVLVSDINGDNKNDIILGNLGLNHVLKGDDDQLVLALNDYNKDQILDPLVAYEKGSSILPIYHKRQIERRFNDLKKEIPSHQSYAQTPLSDIFEDEVMKNTFIKRTDELRSFALMNKGDKSWEKVVLPMSIQSCPIYAIVEHDGTLYMSGGDRDYMPVTGNMSASFISKLWMEDDSFIMEKIPNLPKGSIRHLSITGDHLMVVRNDGPITKIRLE